MGNERTTPRLRTRSRVGVGLVALALAVSGCTSGAAEGDGADVTAVDINAVPREDLTDGGVLRWPITTLPQQWNYFHMNGADPASADVLGAVLPRLWTYDEHAVATPNQDYLLSAEVTATTPKQVVTYTLNPRARWSDGTDMSWREFEAQWRALSGQDHRFENVATEGYNRIESVRQGQDSNQAVVTYGRPFGAWQSIFDPLYPAAVMSNPEAFNKGWVGKIPLTAGPFKFGKIDKAAKTVTVVRDEKWWGSPAKLDRIEFRALSLADQLEAFAEGKIDFVPVGTNAQAYERVKALPGAHVRKAAAPDFTVLTFNGTSPVLRDKRVRQALALAIDREAIANEALEAVEWPGVPMNNHVFVNTHAGYQNNAGERATVDPAAAGELLDELGWRMEGEVRKRRGQLLRLAFMVPENSPRTGTVAQQVQDQLKRIGVRVELHPVAADRFFDDYITPGNFDLAASAWRGSAYPISATRQIYTMPRRDENGELQIEQNFARVGSPHIDRALEAAVTELDPNAAARKANAADKLIWEEAHSLTLYQQPQIVACKQNLANFGANGFQSVVYENIGFTE